MKNDLIMDRNKQQLKNIFKDRIDELSDRVQKSKETGELFGCVDNEIWNRQISLLYWVDEVLDNPKKWEVNDREQNLTDKRIMDTKEVK